MQMTQRGRKGAANLITIGTAIAILSLFSARPASDPPSVFILLVFAIALIGYAHWWAKPAPEDTRETVVEDNSDDDDDGPIGGST